MYEIHLAKESFKFSCSHFTILSADRAERLHGHNYYVRVDLTVGGLDPALGMAFDYNRVKPVIRAFCERLDERILVPSKSPHLKITAADEVTVQFGTKRYVFPSEDVTSLPIANVTCEELARLAAEDVRAQLSGLPHWTHVRVHVEETRGQSVSFALPR